MKNPKNTKKKKKNLICTLPLELLEEILLRLPVRSLLRFKCVCKSWLSLISDPQFAKSHFDLAAAPSYRLLRFSYGHKSLVCSIDIDASLNSSAVYSLPSPPCPPEFSVSDAECVASCRGFVLLFYEWGKRTYLYLWNPSTASHKQLPGSFSNLTYFYNYGLGYDASTDDYFIFIVRMRRHPKLPHVTEEYNPTPRIELFSVKNNSWKFIDGLNLPYESIGYNRAAFPLNGALHWAVLSHDKNVPVIIAFDLMERTFSEIPLPHDLTVGSNCWAYSLRVMGGCLSLWRVETNEIWVMKEYKVQSSWTMSFVFSETYFPVCTTKDGEIFGSSLIDKRLEKRNEKGKLLEHLSCGFCGFPMGTCCVPTSIYRESLLSLPQVSLEETSGDGQW